MFSLTNLWAVIRREMRVYYTSPIAYAVMVIFLVVSGYFYFVNFTYFALLSFQVGQNPYLATLNVNERVLAPTFGDMAVVLLFIMPLLTMRLFAEEKKAGTFELVMSYPLRESEIILGKFFAAFGVFGSMMIPTLLFPVMAVTLAQTDLGPVVTAYLGLILLGAAFISLGLFLSSLTENQIVAAVLTLGSLMVLWLIGNASRTSSSTLAKVLSDISIIAHFDGFHQGLIDTRDLVYYVLFTLFFLFLTARSLESKRWRG